MSGQTLLNAGIIVFCQRFWMFTSPSEAKVKLSADPQSTAVPPPVPAALLVPVAEPAADPVPEPDAEPAAEPVPEPAAEPVPELVAEPVPELVAALVVGEDAEVLEPELLLELQAATVKAVVRMAAAARRGLVRISAPRLCVGRDRPIGVRRSAGLAPGPYRA
jgi:hypothetical protein